MNWVELAFIQACMEESACGFSVCVRTHLSPLRGSCLSHFDPRLTPWALLSRRFAAWDRSVHSTLYAATELSRTEALVHSLTLARARRPARPPRCKGSRIFPQACEGGLILRPL